jgi:hypothetical protein
MGGSGTVWCIVLAGYVTVFYCVSDKVGARVDKFIFES